MFERLCYIGSMPTIRDEKKEIMIGTKVGESVKREIDRIADADNRKAAYVIRELLMRGLTLYRLDGKLRDDSKPGVMAAEILIDSSSVKRGKVVGTISSPLAETRRMVNSDQVERMTSSFARPCSIIRIPAAFILRTSRRNTRGVAYR